MSKCEVKNALGMNLDHFCINSYVKKNITQIEHDMGFPSLHPLTLTGASVMQEQFKLVSQALHKSH